MMFVECLRMYIVAEETIVEYFYRVYQFCKFQTRLNILNAEFTCFLDGL